MHHLIGKLFIHRGILVRIYKIEEDKVYVYSNRSMLKEYRIKVFENKKVIDNNTILTHIGDYKSEIVKKELNNFFKRFIPYTYEIELNKIKLICNDSLVFNGVFQFDALSFYTDKDYKHFLLNKLEKAILFDGEFKK